MKKLCMISSCSNKVHARGVCHKHYLLVKGDIKTGSITEAQAVALGKLAPLKSVMPDDSLVSRVMELLHAHERVADLESKLTRIRAILDE